MKKHICTYCNGVEEESKVCRTPNAVKEFFNNNIWSEPLKVSIATNLEVAISKGIPFSIINDVGHTVSYMYVEVGTCRVCRKTNTPLIATHFKTPRVRVDVCQTCKNGLDFRQWEPYLDSTGKVRIRRA